MISKFKIFRSVPFLLMILCISLGFNARVAAQEDTRYYLGVLAEGYPASMVISEFNYANARVVNLSEPLILFSITDKTKLTTFFKNLPFLAEVYVDMADLKNNPSLIKHPLMQEFLSLQHRERPAEEGNPKTQEPTPAKITQAPREAKPVTTQNLLVIDQLIREKAKQIRAAKNTQKQE